MDNVLLSVHTMHTLRTNRIARSAAFTSVPYEYQFGFRPARLGTVAPPAGQWASFEIHGHADPRAVVDGERIHVKDEPFGVVIRNQVL